MTQFGHGLGNCVKLPFMNFSLDLLLLSRPGLM
jgi:hypothetical protein